MPRVTAFGSTDFGSSFEELGFGSNHRRDGANLDTEIPLSESEQVISDLSINTDQIESMKVNKLRAGDILVDEYLQSTGFVTGSTGWQIKGNGDVEFNSGTFRGSLIAGELHIPDRDSTANSWHVNTTGDMWLGATETNFNADPDNATAYILNTGVAKFLAATTIGSNSDAENQIVSDGSTVTINKSNMTFEDIFGDGSDGAATISSNTSLTADMHYTNLTVDATFTLDAAGFRIFVSGVLTVNGTIARDGNAGTNGATAAGIGAGGAGGAGGAALATGSLYGAAAGVAGGNGEPLTSNTGTNGTSLAKCMGSAGSAGGIGGDPTGGGFAAGSAGAKTGTVFNKPTSVIGAFMLYDIFPAADNLRSSAGSGSGSGGGWRGAGSNGAGGGGGSGSSGGIVAVYAREIIIGAAGIIRANGGAGGDGGSDGGAGANGGVGGGGAGGSGGVVLLVYSKLTNSGTIEAAGGAAGALGSTGSTANSTAATAGVAGAVIQLQV
jgi:hypothetical protein